MRRIREQKATEYSMQLRIVNNPHTKKETQNELLRDIQALLPKPLQSQKSGLDKTAFRNLKNKLYKSGGITVK